MLRQHKGFISACFSGWRGASQSSIVLDCYLMQSERTIRATSISPRILATPRPSHIPVSCNGLHLTLLSGTYLERDQTSNIFWSLPFEPHY